MDISEFDMTNEQIILARGMARQRPVNGSLELLPLCNMNCDMCYIRKSREEVDAGGGLRTAQEWMDLADEMVRSGVLFLLLTGGEPLLFPDFRKLYLKLKKSGIILTINTNGTLIDEDWADFFAAHTPRRINITLYGSGEESYERLCHYPGGFSRTLEAIRLLRQRGVDVKINGSVTRYNRQDMEAIYQIARQLDVPIHMDTYMLPGLRERNLPFSKQSRLLPEEAAAAEIVMKKNEKTEEEFQRYVLAAIEQIEKEAPSYPGRISCLAGNCSFAIGWQGKIRPCVTLDAPAVPVFERGFEEAWKEISRDAKQLQLNSACVSCRLRPICQICVASAMLETGSYDKAPEYLCRYARQLYGLLKKEFLQIQEKRRE